MLQYLIYFLIGGVLVSSVAYLGSRGDGVVAAFVASLPALFLLNVFIMYRLGGVDGSLVYAKGVLLFLPVFVFYAALTIWLLPRLGVPQAMLPGLPLYLAPLVARKLVRRKISRASLEQEGDKSNA